jgi:transcriptional regulator with XRE-family HTH domain
LVGRSQIDVTKVASFGEYLRRRRAELGLTQLDVAKAVDYKNAEYIGLLENPEKNSVSRKLNPDKLPRLAEILKVPLKDLAKLYLEEHSPVLAMALFSGGAEIRRGAFRLNHEDEFVVKLKTLPIDTREPIIKMVNSLYEQAHRNRNTTRSA